MNTSELLKRLIIAFNKKDENEFYNITQEYIEFEQRKKNNIKVKELKELLYNKDFFSNGNGNNKNINKPIPRDSEKGFPLLEIKKSFHMWDELFLDKDTIEILKQIAIEYKEKEILNTYHLKHKNKILFCGKPGTGKTFTAQILSSELYLPLVYVRFDSIVSSYLGETATNLRKVFDYIANDSFIVLFDEFDIIGKNRNDHYEHGEIKRVVNNFLQMLDNFDGDSVIIASTNHHHILDPAIWRRFDEVVYFGLPNLNLRKDLFNFYLKSMPKSQFDFNDLVKLTNGLSPSDIRLICIESMKHAILSKRDSLNKNDLEYSVERLLDRQIIYSGKKK